MAVGNIESLKEEIDALKETLLSKEAELYRLKVKALPWRVGDVVLYRNAEHKIVGVHYLCLVSYDNGGWPRLVRRNKDGSWSKAQMNPCRSFTAADVIRHESSDNV